MGFYGRCEKDSFARGQTEPSVSGGIIYDTQVEMRKTSFGNHPDRIHGQRGLFPHDRLPKRGEGSR
jgi:hypothetical protein